MFKLVSRPDPAPMEFLVVNNEAITFGECLKFDANGRLTAATPGGPVAAVAQQNVTAGTDKMCKVIITTGEQIWEADYTGTPAAGFVVGCASANIATGGLSLDAANVTSGPCSILSINTTAKKALVQFKNRVFN